MFAVGQRLTIKLPSGKCEAVTIVHLTPTVAIIRFGDQTTDAVHVSRLVMLQDAAK